MPCGVSVSARVTACYPQDNVCSICRDAKFCVSTTPQVLTFPHHSATFADDSTIPLTALHRRFSFEEMMPDKKALEGKTVCNVGLDELLETINKRIVALKDREHQIGHSYFMGLETDSDLKDVFKDKIIPLLQEYFYGDYKKIYYVLGPGFVEKKTEKTIFAVENPDYDEFDIPEERYDIASFDAEFNIKDAIEKMEVQKLDSGTGATAESEESKDKE